MRSMAVCLLFAPAVVFAADPPKFDGLGKHTRPVSANKDAQAYFDQGLAFLYAFNHDEAIRAFEHAATLDPECAMAHWGVALACGGHINKPLMDPDRAKQAYAAAQRAMGKLVLAKNADATLVQALAERYTDPPASADDQAKLNAAYSAAMMEASISR